MPELTPKRRSELRAEAHKLKPTVIIGDKGLTDEVLAEVDRALKAHELIKVRAATDEREARDVWLETLCERLAAHPVQQIGKIFVIYREEPEKHAKGDARPLPRSRGAGKPPRAGGAGKPPRGGSGAKQRRGREDADVKRTSHPRSRTPSPRPASAPRRRRPRTSR